MRPIRRSIAHIVPLVGIELMLAGLFGGPALPAASAADMDRLIDRNDWVVQRPYGYHHPRGQQHSWGRRDPWSQQDSWGQRHRRGRPDPWGYRHDRPSRRSGYGLPDRYTIHRGKSASCGVSASGALATTAAANTGANGQGGSGRGHSS